MPIMINRTKGTKYIIETFEVKAMIVKHLKETYDFVSADPRVVFEINDEFELIGVKVYDQTSCPTCGSD